MRLTLLLSLLQLMLQGLQAVALRHLPASPPSTLPLRQHLLSLVQLLLEHVRARPLIHLLPQHSQPLQSATAAILPPVLGPASSSTKPSASRPVTTPLGQSQRSSRAAHSILAGQHSAFQHRSNNAADHAKHLEHVLQVLQDNKLQCKLKRCDFNKIELNLKGSSLDILLEHLDSRQTQRSLRILGTYQELAKTQVQS